MIKIVLKLLVAIFSFMLIAELFFLYNYQLSVKTGRVSYLDILLDTDVVSKNVVQKGDLLQSVLIALFLTILLLFAFAGMLVGKNPKDDEDTLREKISSADSPGFFKSGEEFLHRKK